MRRGLTAWTRAVLWLERAWRAGLAWPTGAAGLFALAAAGGLAHRLPPDVRLTALGGIAGWLLVAVVLAARQVRWPRMADAARRLERANELPSGQLRLLADRLAQPEDRDAALLWDRARAASAASRLRPPAPRLGHPALPALIAAGGGAAAVVAVIVAPTPLLRGFSPYRTDLSGGIAVVAVRPPAYTGQDARLVTLRHGEHADVAAPAGSTVRLSRALPEGAWSLQPSGTELSVRFGARDFARIALSSLPDRAPRVEWAAPPRAAVNGLLAVPYRLTDDYPGLALSLEVRPDDGGVRHVSLAAGLAQGEGMAAADLTADPAAGGWAGLTLVARDAAGQTARSAPVRLLVPARAFRDSLARAIVDVRAALLSTPAARLPVVAQIDSLSIKAARAGPPAATFPALRASAHRLAGRDPDAVPSTAQLLWDAAIARDGGPDAKAAAALAQLLDRLGDALSRTGGEAEARAAAQALEDAARAARSTPGSGSAGLDAGALAGMAREIGERLAAGDRAGARALLQALRGMVEQARLAGPGGVVAGAVPAGFDPLGRPGAGFGGGRVRLLEPARAAELERIRATLRERAADPERPPAERDYYGRLIGRF